MLSITQSLVPDKKYSTSHASINVTENIRKALDDGNIGRGVLVKLQKAFNTVDHQTLLKTKLNHQGICGVSNNWFKSYLSYCSQISINGYESGLASINFGAPEGCVLKDPFLLYINVPNEAVKFCEVHHFADDNNFLCLSNSMTKMNKLV